MPVMSTVIGVLGMNVGALALVLCRSWAFHTRLYRPMLLNIALSIAPVLVLLVIGAGLLLGVATAVPGLLLLLWGAVGLGVWLLVLPNAGYLITELNLSHRQQGDGVPEWYDVMLVLTLAMSGVLNTVVNVFVAVLSWIVVRYDDLAPLTGTEARVAVAVVLLLASFGIYLGRNLRLNSWDVRHPWGLLTRVVRHLGDSGHRGNAVGQTLVGAAFLGLMYLVVVGPLTATLAADGP